MTDEDPEDVPAEDVPAVTVARARVLRLARDNGDDRVCRSSLSRPVAFDACIRALWLAERGADEGKLTRAGRAALELFDAHQAQRRALAKIAKGIS